jgi:hypothetical protein
MVTKKERRAKERWRPMETQPVRLASILPSFKIKPVRFASLLPSFGISQFVLLRCCQDLK